MMSQPSRDTGTRHRLNLRVRGGNGAHAQGSFKKNNSIDFFVKNKYNKNVPVVKSRD